eukprot:4335625-Pyramimonas_sp.AAC.1
MRNNNLREVGHQYRALKAHPDSAEFQALLQEGADATERAHNGELAFGCRMADIADRNRARVAMSYVKDLAGDGTDENQLEEVCAAMGTPESANT